MVNTMPADALATFRSQGISRHGIDPQSRNILSPVSKELDKGLWSFCCQLPDTFCYGSVQDWFISIANIQEIMQFCTYRKVSNIGRILVGNKIVDHSDVVGASPVGAAPTTSSFST